MKIKAMHKGFEIEITGDDPQRVFSDFKRMIAIIDKECPESHIF